MSEKIKETYIRMLSHTIHYDCCYDADADNDFEKISDYITNLQQKVEQLENIRKEAIKLIEEDVLGKKIENVNWDYDECYYSDMPVERVKPLLNILNKGSDKENASTN